MQEEDPMNKKDSRMTKPLEKRVERKNMKEIDKNKEYIIGVSSTRKEDVGYTLYYAGKTLRVNEEMKDFIIEKRNSFKITDFPIEYQEKASFVAKMLINGGFLYDKK
jgi:hypothetical protein